MRSAHIRTCRGFTMAEVLTVITIIGILVLISLPNILGIMQMNRFRTSANDLLVKVRYARSLAIKARKRITMIIDLNQESFRLIKPGHTEYDLMKDISGAVSAGIALDDRYILYVEKSGAICVNSWNNSQVSSGACAYYIGETQRNNAVDQVISAAPAVLPCAAGPQPNTVQLEFEPSGILNQPTCTIRLTSTQLNRSHDLTVYRGGQITLQ